MVLCKHHFKDVSTFMFMLICLFIFPWTKITSLTILVEMISLALYSIYFNKSNMGQALHYSNRATTFLIVTYLLCITAHCLWNLTYY